MTLLFSEEEKQIEATSSISTLWSVCMCSEKIQEMRNNWIQYSQYEFIINGIAGFCFYCEWFFYGYKSMVFLSAFLVFKCKCGKSITRSTKFIRAKAKILQWIVEICILYMIYFLYCASYIQGKWKHFNDNMSSYIYFYVFIYMYEQRNYIVHFDRFIWLIFFSSPHSGVYLNFHETRPI